MDEFDTMDLVEMLSGADLPQRHKTTQGDEFSLSHGYRIIDLRLLRSALAKSQVRRHCIRNLAIKKEMFDSCIWVFKGV